MSRPLTTVLTLAIVATLLQMIYTSIFFLWHEEVIDEGAPRQLQMFVSRSQSNHTDTDKTKPAQSLPSRSESNHTGNGTAAENFHLLPKKLITVFGLESSGTTLIAEALAESVGAETVGIFEGLIYRIRKQHRNRIEIQHISQPWGFFHNDEGLDNQTVAHIDFLPPYECMSWPHYSRRDLQEFANKAKPHPRCFNETGLQKRVVLPKRFMVNITSHVRWYREQGVEATAVVVVRDDYAHLHGKMRTHNGNLTYSVLEDMRAKELIVEAMHQLDSLPRNGRAPQIILVSYETLMSLREPYLFDLYQRLGINSTHTPILESGNKKYITAPNGTDTETWWNVDTGNFKIGR